MIIKPGTHHHAIRQTSLLATTFPTIIDLPSIVDPVFEGPDLRRSKIFGRLDDQEAQMTKGRGRFDLLLTSIASEGAPAHRMRPHARHHARRLHLRNEDAQTPADLEPARLLIGHRHDYNDKIATLVRLNLPWTKILFGRLPVATQ